MSVVEKETSVAVPAVVATFAMAVYRSRCGSGGGCNVFSTGTCCGLVMLQSLLL